MGLTPDELDLVDRISKRLQNVDPETYRAGGRTLAHQAIEHRGSLVRTLRGALAELDSRQWDERRQGYQEALEDVLLAAEAALEPREQMDRAQASLKTSPALKKVLAEVARGPLTPSEAARRLGKSAPMGTRYFDQLRTLGLLMELDGLDGREHPHRVTPLGARLADRAAVNASASDLDGDGDSVTTERELRAAKTVGKPLSKRGVLNAVVDELEGKDIPTRWVKEVIETLAVVGTKELKKNGVFELHGLAKFVMPKKPARPVREAINPFTKEKLRFAAKPASKLLRARTIKTVKDAMATERKGT